MAEENADCLERRAVVVEVRREGVPKRVRVKPIRIEPAGLRDRLDDAANGSHVEPLRRSARSNAEKQCARFEAPSSKQALATWQPGLEGLACAFSDDDESLFFPLPSNKQKIILAEVFQVDADELRDAQPAAVEQLKDQALALWHHCPFDQFLYLVVLCDVGELLAPARAGDQSDQVGIEQAFGFEPLAEALYGREFSAHRHVLRACIVELNDNGADQLAGYLVDGGLASP